jgi:hypothetical protein
MSFVAMFAALTFVKVFHWLVQVRCRAPAPLHSEVPADASGRKRPPLAHLGALRVLYNGLCVSHTEGFYAGICHGVCWDPAAQCDS